MPEPKRVSKVRVWSAADIKRVRRLKNHQRAEYAKYQSQAIKAIGKPAMGIGLSPTDIRPDHREAGIPLRARALLRRLKDKEPPKILGFHPDESLLSPQELAQRLKVPVSWVYEQTRKRAGIHGPGVMPHIKMRKYLRFAWSDVVPWLRKLQIGTTGGQ
jgi:hypothetical protein